MLYQALNRQVFNLKSSKVAPRAVGIEVEMEFSKGFEYQDLSLKYPGWVVKGDGSLRNFGLEFVSAPTDIEKLGELMSQWDHLINEPVMKTRIDGCPRASVHVHTNVRDYTYNQLMNILVAYTILEGIMVTYCGKYRKGNLFALRVPEASYNFDQIRKSNRRYNILSVQSDARYSALNVASLRTFGTLEFRSFGANYSSEEISLWVRGVRRLVDHAATFKNPPAVYARYVELSKFQFIREFLGDLGEEILKKHGDEVEERVNDGEEYAITFLASHPDNWEYTSDWRGTPGFVEWWGSQTGKSALYADENSFKSWEKKQAPEKMVFDPDLGFTPETAVGRIPTLEELPVEAFTDRGQYTMYLAERRRRQAENPDGVVDENLLLQFVWDTFGLSTRPLTRLEGRSWTDVVRNHLSLVRAGQRQPAASLRGLMFDENIRENAPSSMPTDWATRPSFNIEDILPTPTNLPRRRR